MTPTQTAGTAIVSLGGHMMCFMAMPFSDGVADLYRNQGLPVACLVA